MSILDGRYEVVEQENSVIVKGVKNFNPKHIFDCGQCFRWIEQEDGSYIGVALEKVIRVSLKNKDTLVLDNTNKQEFYDCWFDYFDLGTDYSEIKKQVTKDDIMEKAVEFGGGIRILRQDFYETLISFIISANNRIPRIMKSIDLLSQEYGEKLEFEGKEYFTFPKVEVLAGLTAEDISFCKAGFRCKYIINTSKMLMESGLLGKGHVFTREELMAFNGVGPKVADCVLLFSGTRHDVFPIDVWVKRVMEELYFSKEATFKEIANFARAYFGDYAGYAQQYLFYYARSNKIGAK